MVPLKSTSSEESQGIVAMTGMWAIACRLSGSRSELLAWRKKYCLYSIVGNIISYTLFAMRRDDDADDDTSVGQYATAKRRLPYQRLLCLILTSL